MKEEREHASFEELNDLIDGRLDQNSATRIREHLIACESCRLEHGQLTALLTAASETQLSVDPGPDLWEDVRRTIESRKEVALPGLGHAPAMLPTKRPVRVSPSLLAVAAVVLIVLSSGITSIVLRRPSTPVAQVPVTTTERATVLPVVVRSTEDEYARTIRELRISVDAQRTSLSTETIRTVDHSLAIVDSAIAEARAALIADPNNRTLVDLLASSYQRKLDLLRRTSELSSKI
jgi:hypothetical protein